MKGCCLLACVADCLVAEKNSLEFGAINGQVLTDRREGGRIHFAPLQSALKVVRNSFPFSIPTELYERLTRL